MLDRLDRLLRGIGHRIIDRIWRLGAGARFFFYIFIYSGESFRRFSLTVREIYFTG
ncbi:MAG TPA: ABC transporter permease, partial [Methylophilaceae bacterium]|nr:ABC transporter permease [Methylophilaceae bacterium]